MTQSLVSIFCPQIFRIFSALFIFKLVGCVLFQRFVLHFSAFIWGVYAYTPPYTLPTYGPTVKGPRLMDILAHH